MGQGITYIVPFIQFPLVIRPETGRESKAKANIDRIVNVCFIIFNLMVIEN
jgi:hypothetical protein